MSSATESKRNFVKALGAAAGGLVVGGAGTYFVRDSQVSTLRGELDRLTSEKSNLQTQVDLLTGERSTLQSQLSSLNTDLTDTKTQLGQSKTQLAEFANGYVVYGGGINVKFLPDPQTGRPTVPMEEVWHFDPNFAFCRVDNNPQAFSMDTFKLGKVTIDANSFSMVMLTDTASIAGFTLIPEGAASIKLTGNLDCATEAVVAGTKFGSKQVQERGDYEIVAVHDGKLGDSFAFTAFFNETSSPVNYAIFGPKFTFTGKIVSGGVTIKPIQSSLLKPKS